MARGMRVKRAEYYADLGYEPREWQQLCDDALDNQGKRFVSAFSFPRGGKSYWAARYVGPRLLQPDHHAWIAAPTYELGSKEFLYIYNDLLNLGFLNMPGVRKSRDVRGGMFIQFPWGSFLKVVSADRPDSLRAEELDSLILAEASALPKDIFLHNLYIRVEKRKGKVLVPTTPKGFTWVYDLFRIPSIKTIRGQDNPHYDPEFYSLVISSDPEMVRPDDPDMADIHEGGVYDKDTVDRARRLLPRPIFVEQFGGGFAAYAGLVFPYNPSKHRVPAFEIPDHWTHCVGYDHGSGTNNNAILAFSYDEKGHSYWWGQIKSSGQTARQHLAGIRALFGEKKWSAFAIDPSSKQTRIELSDLGVPTTIAFDKHESAGIIRLTSMLNEGSMHLLEGRVPDLEHDFFHMEWDDEIPGKVRNSKQFHFIAAARYGSLARVGLPQIEAVDQYEQSKDPVWRAAWKEVMDIRRREALTASLGTIPDDDMHEDMVFTEEWDRDMYEEFY